MINRTSAPVLALLVRSAPYQRRSARAELDIALAALTMEIRLETYFIGSSVLMLQAERSPDSARLPVGYKAWGALPDLGDCSIYAESAWLERLTKSANPLVLPVEGLDLNEIGSRWRQADYAMVI